MKKKLIKIIFSIFLIFMVVITVNFISTIRRPLKINNDEVITVNEGDSFYSILERLKEEKKIRNTFFIKTYMKLAGIDTEVYPGNHVLKKDNSVKELAQLLKTKDESGISITIPEGYTIEDISELLDEKQICSKEQFLQAVNTYPLPRYAKSNNNKKYNLEGYLFPDTYIINKDATADEIIEIMLHRFEEMWDKAITETNIMVNENNIEYVLTVASMVEKEATLDEERDIISSVMYNRLEEDMKLQIDATVIYALGYHVEQVLFSHLDIDSPYNTYVYSGLPIGPICNPGYNSIVAALNPKHTDYMYYLVESAGKHYFTNNYKDFLDKREILGY